ncbi:hypothetical protein J2127_001228 [Methanococcus voltae]|uniref:hypothetical protein n=1 Tax=Methanococcus voltae TaxID=2188 RepID=UPI001AE983D3|nr:hypothetical protein [Methanococcus voltae]MBP2144058.1 hypothetical protein [Methanococcus voltae]
MRIFDDLENITDITMKVNDLKEVRQSKKKALVFGKYRGLVYGEPMFVISVYGRNLFRLICGWNSENEEVILVRYNKVIDGYQKRHENEALQKYMAVADVVQDIEKYVSENEKDVSFKMTETPVKKWVEGGEYVSTNLTIWETFKECGYNVYRPLNNIPEDVVIKL